MTGFVFDLDNTLYDRYGTMEEIFRRSYDRMKKYINPAYDFEKTVTHACRSEALFIFGGWESVYSHLVEENFFNRDNIPSFKKVREFMLDGFSSVAVPHPYTIPVLNQLKEKGYKLAILTNASLIDYQNKKIQILGIAEYFDEIVVSGQYSMLMCGKNDNTDYFKPNASLFEYMASLLDERPSDLYYVGDNPTADVIGAINGGYVPVWIRSRSPWILDNSLMPKHSFDTIEGVLTLI